MRNAPCYSLDPVISVLRDEWADPVQIIAVEEHVLSAPNEGTIDLSDLMTAKFSLLGTKRSERKIRLGP
jgi:hypothetical protein